MGRVAREAACGMPLRRFRARGRDACSNVERAGRPVEPHPGSIGSSDSASPDVRLLGRAVIRIRHQLHLRRLLAVDGELTENVHRMSAGTVALVRRAVDFLVVGVGGGHGAAEGEPHPAARQGQPPRTSGTPEGAQRRATDRAQPARGLAAGSGGLGCTQASTRASGRASNSLQT